MICPVSASTSGCGRTVSGCRAKASDGAEVAVIGGGVSGLGAAYLLVARARRPRCSSRTPAPGGHANTVVHDGLALDTGFLVHNTRNYPLLCRLFEELGVATHESEMSFSVSCPGCGLEYSGRRPFARARNAASPRFLTLLWEIGRWLRTARRVARACGLRRALARAVPRTQPLLAAVPAPLPGSAQLRALVDGAGSRPRVPGCLRDPLLRQPRHARLRALSLAHRHRREQALRRRDRGTPRRAAAPRLRRPLDPPQRRRRRAADGRRRRRTASTTSSSPRTPTRRSRCSRIRRRRAPRSRRLRLHAERGRPAHRLLLSSGRAAGARLLELPRRRRRPPDDHLSPQSPPGARCGARLLRDAEPRRCRRSTCSGASPTRIRSSLSRRCARSVSSRRSAAGAALCGRVLRQRLPRGRARERRRRGRALGVEW